MNADVCKEKSGDVPLYALCFFCFLFLIFYNMWLTVSENLPHGTDSSGTDSKKSNVSGLCLKAVAKISSSLTSFLSTSFLLIGTAKKNLFLYFPWLVFVFKGILIIHSLNLLDLPQFFQQTGTGETGWKSYLLYFVVIALDMAECFCLRKILEMFYELWMTPKNEEEVEEKGSESSEEEVNKAVESRIRKSLLNYENGQRSKSS